MTGAQTGLGTPEQLRDPNFTPPLAMAIPLGIQHVLAMFVSNVTPAIIVAGAAGFGPSRLRAQSLRRQDLQGLPVRPRGPRHRPGGDPDGLAPGPRLARPPLSSPACPTRAPSGPWRALATSPASRPAAPPRGPSLAGYVAEVAEFLKESG